MASKECWRPNARVHPAVTVYGAWIFNSLAHSRGPEQWRRGSEQVLESGDVVGEPRVRHEPVAALLPVMTTHYRPGNG